MEKSNISRGQFLRSTTILVLNRLTSLRIRIILQKMKSQKQIGFRLLEGNNVKHFGGAYLGKGNPKEKRPVSIRRAMHLVMRSSRAKGPISFLRKDQIIKDLINKQGKDLDVKVYKVANGGSHLHLVILPKSRAAFNKFVRAISGLIVRAVLDAERGRAKIGSVQFWDQRPFTRIVEWGREYRGVCHYLLQNTLEALGFIPYTPRVQRLIGIKSTS